MGLREQQNAVSGPSKNACTTAPDWKKVTNPEHPCGTQGVKRAVWGSKYNANSMWMSGGPIHPCCIVPT